MLCLLDSGIFRLTLYYSIEKNYAILIILVTFMYNLFKLDKCIQLQILSIYSEKTLKKQSNWLETNRHWSKWV